MRKTTLTSLLGATLPKTHAAVVSINDVRKICAYGGGRGGKVYRARIEAEKAKSRLEVFWCDEAALSDPWKPLTLEEILSDINNLLNEGEK